jgi:hypothetical protein
MPALEAAGIFRSKKSKTRPIAKTVPLPKHHNARACHYSLQLNILRAPCWAYVHERLSYFILAQFVLYPALHNDVISKFQTNYAKRLGKGASDVYNSVM